jgi:HD-like signal output (HDOD) protein
MKESIMPTDSLYVTDASIEPSFAIAQTMQQKARKLPVLPAVAVQALNIAKNPDASITEFAAIVERDVKLATCILKMANGAIYAPTKPVASLYQAVVRLGFHQCRNLILSASISSMMRKTSLSEEWIGDLLWKHSALTGIIAVHMNRALNIGYSGEEFTAGLIHDIGRLLFASCVPQQFAEIDPLDFVENNGVLSHEESIIGTPHTEFGAWFSVENNLPECLTAVIRHHHAPNAAGQHIKLTALTAAADHLANYFQRYESIDGYDLSTNDAVAILERVDVRHASERLATILSTLIDESVRDADSFAQV